MPKDAERRQETPQERLTSAVQAIQNRGIGIDHDAGQVLRQMLSIADSAMEVPPKHLLPPGVETYYEPKVTNCQRPGNTY